MEESQTIEANNKLNDDSTVRSPYLLAWSALFLLATTWLCIFFGFSTLTKKTSTMYTKNRMHLTQLQEQLSQTQTTYQTLQQNFIQLQNALQKKFPVNTDIVRINEARQLIQLAYYNLTYLQDATSALSSLNLAKQQLSELINPATALLTLRQQLAENIASLSALPHFDLNNVLAKLDDLQKLVIQLPLQGATLTPQKEISPSTSQTLVNKWITAIQSSLHHLLQLIVIRHLDAPIEPLLPQVQQQYLVHNLQLLFQEAGWALLHNQPVPYQANLQRAKEAIRHYFVVNTEKTQAALQTLNELEKINTQTVFPDLTPTLQTIDSLSKTLTDQISSVAQTGSGG
jgi:uroporphyrin-III C-methyltransferase